MGANNSKFGLEKALGNTLVLRVTNPTIRGSVRRTDTDGGHASPYFLGLNGKTLTVNVTPVGDLVITFVSDLMTAAITTINAASPTNLKAIDDDGYLRITNLNTGNKNSLTIKSGNAATLLGFVLDPEPGSVSYAGELATSSPGRSLTNVQSNPQGTHLIANDEDLTSGVINRSILGSVEHLDRIIRDLDIEIPIVKKITVTTTTLPTTAERVFVITDPTIRFPVDGFELVVTNPSGFVLDQLVRLKSFPDDIDFYDISQTDPVPHITKVIYNTGAIGVSDTTQTFTTWGTPDGKSVFLSQLRNKQPPVNITNIRGNVIEASSAAFVTNNTQSGDTVIIESATNNTPFNHNGEYVVTEVIDGTRLAIRAKGSSEKTFVSSNKPTELNKNLPGGTSYGTVRIIVGAFIPATALTFVVPSWVPNATTFYVHLYHGVRIRDLQPGDIGVRFSANDEAILTILRTHITTAASFRHHAIDIDYAGGSTWHDGTTNPAATVEAQLDKIINDLSGTAGAIKIGYAGGNNWADGTTNPTTSIEQQLDKIITDLVGSAGTGKIQGSAVGTDLIVNRLDQQLADLAVNWLKMSRANTISGAQTFSALLTTAAITASGLITANAGLTAGNNQNIKIQGTGVYQHPTQTITIPGIEGRFENTVANSATLSIAGTGSLGWNGPTTNIAGYSIMLPVGKRVSAIRASVLDNPANSGGPGPTRITMTGFGFTNTPVTSTGSGGTTTITLTFTPFVIAANTPYWLLMTYPDGGNLSVAIKFIAIDYDQP